MPQFGTIGKLIRRLNLIVVPPSLDSTKNVNVSSDISVTATSTTNCVCNAQMNSNIVSVSTQQCDSSQIASISSRLGRLTVIGTIYFTLASWWKYIRRILFG
jgi:arginine repressor